MIVQALTISARFKPQRGLGSGSGGVGRFQGGEGEVLELSVRSIRLQLASTLVIMFLSACENRHRVTRGDAWTCIR